MSVLFPVFFRQDTFSRNGSSQF